MFPLIHTSRTPPPPQDFLKNFGIAYTNYFSLFSSQTLARGTPSLIQLPLLSKNSNILHPIMFNLGLLSFFLLMALHGFHEGHIL